MAMTISDQGLVELTQREGLRTNAYRDVRGIWTIGVGHTSAAGPPDVYQGLTISVQDAHDIFRNDLKTFEQCVNDCVTVTLTQNQYDALVSICYNIGTHAFAHSSFVDDLDNGNFDKVDQDIMKWNKPAAIIGRRESEVEQFNE